LGLRKSVTLRCSDFKSTVSPADVLVPSDLVYHKREAATVM
jgi:hypothetical protein